MTWRPWLPRDFLGRSLEFATAMSVPLRALLRRLSTSHGTYSVDNIQSLSGKKLSALYSSRFPSESSFSLAALLAGAGVFTVAALSPHHCEEEDTLVDVRNSVTHELILALEFSFATEPEAAGGHSYPARPRRLQGSRSIKED